MDVLLVKYGGDMGLIIDPIIFEIILLLCFSIIIMLVNFWVGLEAFIIFLVGLYILLRIIPMMNHEGTDDTRKNTSHNTISNHET